LERDWVAGITTISFRARYLTLLPWLLAELYGYELKRRDGKAVITEERLSEVLARLKFVMLAASATQFRTAYQDLLFLDFAYVYEYRLPALIAAGVALAAFSLTRRRLERTEVEIDGPRRQAAARLPDQARRQANMRTAQLTSVDPAIQATDST